MRFAARASNILLRCSFSYGTMSPSARPSRLIASAVQPLAALSPLRHQPFSSRPVDIQKEIDTIGDMFSVAREDLEYATESKGTTYYNEDKLAAQESVEACLKTYEGLIEQLPDQAQRQDVERRIGLRIQELKAQLQALNADELDD
ncbi:uncharacterized protein BJ171DRAFT_105431 [Polychytrium aggregatum]|uniref:uncharacterized protein n=1 Tax=Polychytrium aggregatum TaxID=110093 RepID=UPI0022FDF456|nr:uncharacterized protein BJ171DRAFT_105431 [Polychytrium aggregatum]KAI9204350.1 hypothetical protein BJ171DRAFT_105431 [Polychytrium aggregatum]